MNKPNPLFEYLKLRRETVAYVEELKKEAQRTKCAVGQTKNPFKAVPGLETEFEKAVKTIRYCDNILNEIEKNRERKLRLRRAGVLPRRNRRRTGGTGHVCRADRGGLFRTELHLRRDRYSALGRPAGAGGWLAACRRMELEVNLRPSKQKGGRNEKQQRQAHQVRQAGREGAD